MDIVSLDYIVRASRKKDRGRNFLTENVFTVNFCVLNHAVSRRGAVEVKHGMCAAGDVVAGKLHPIRGAQSAVNNHGTCD